jgi:outer membrane protein OmpA-like peptidoglycan-associated protein
MKTTNKLNIALALGLAGAGCATAAPPSDLINARSSYRHAQESAAASFTPADMHTARKALDAAEQSYLDEGDSRGTRDLAYTANRRAQIAEARGMAAQSTEKQQKTIGDMHSAQTAQVQTTSVKLGLANQKLAMQGQELTTEREARAASDKRAAQAAADLAKYASVKEEVRGMVITLSGGVLFASSKSDLLPGAQVKLNGVADALTQQDPESKMVVEGHTDSQGGMSYNQDLSVRRAEAVRNYLVTRGIAADRVTSQGFGSSRSVADNTSAEGRANNRRVEIVVEPKREAVAVNKP